MAPIQNLTGRARGMLIALILLLNPLLYCWWHTTGGVYPDSVAYLLMAKQLVAQGSLSVASFGHVDTSLILPPLYPLAVGLVSAAIDDALLVSQAINGLALLLAAILLFLWVERASNIWFAAAAVIVLQWQPLYVRYGTSTLTEAFFMLGLCALGYTAGRLLTDSATRPRSYCMLGMGIAMLFLVRQVGLFMLPLLIAICSVSHPGNKWRWRWQPGAAILLGFAILAVPYATLLYGETGQSPWTTSYRMNAYAVTGDQQIQVDESAARGYLEVYAQRRELRQLLPDASEMQLYVVDPRGQTGRGLVAPGEWLANAIANLGHAAAALGKVAVALSILGGLLCLAGFGRSNAFPFQALLPLVSGSYLVALSTQTGVVERYMDVLAPLIIAQAFVGLHVVLAFVQRQATPGRQQLGVAVAVAASMLASSPKLSFAGDLSRKAGERSNPLVKCREEVRPGEGVFAMHPLEAYLAGGTPRILPNDDLDRIAQYARLTGTRWLIYRISETAKFEATLNTHAPWMREPSRLLTNPNYAARCDVPGAILFEIAPT